jgi:uncharacterized membrane protein
MIRFITPAALYLALLAPLLWVVSLARRPERTPRLMISLVLRTLAVLVLAGALAGAELLRPVPQLTVIFLLDRSASVSRDQQLRAEAYVRQALASLPAGDRAGIVSFGRQAAIERFPSVSRTFAPLAPAIGEARTNIADAIQLALGILPASGQRRLVLLSDGGANAGDTQAAARAAMSSGAAFEIVPLDRGPAGLDVQVTGVALPLAARAGERLRMSVQTQSTATTTAQLTVSNNGHPVLTQQVQVPAGANQLDVELPEANAAFNRYEVRLTAGGDVQPENDSGEAFSSLHNHPSVLLVEGSAGAARNLRDALAAASFDVRTIAPDQLPATLPGLARFDAVVLIDVALNDLPPAAVAILPTYVRDLGRGFAMIGGPRSFGPGGYRGSPIEDLLPVKMDPPPQVQQPAVSVVVVIDISGSMTVAEGGVAKMQLAVEGAARIADQLRDDDEITVIPFDHESRGAIGPRSGRDHADLRSMLDGIPTGGSGITMYNALVEARPYLQASTKPIRHLITITDGNDTTQHPGSVNLVRQLNTAGVTVTSVAVGDGEDVPFLKDIAQAGGGRFFLTEQAINLPNIMLDETRLVMQPFVVEQPFVPSQNAAGSAASATGMLRGIAALPTLRGYIATTPKPTAQVLLSTPQGNPLLATPQAGLGRALAWTSDLKGQWATDLVRWPAFPTLAAQMFGWLLPPPGNSNLAVDTRLDGDRLLVTAELHDDRGAPATGLQVAGELAAADGTTFPIVLHETRPGSYAAALGAAPAGTYQIRLVATRANGQPFATGGGGAVVPRASEFRAGPGDAQLLETLAHLTGGRLNPAPTAIYDSTSQSRPSARDLTRPLLWLVIGLLPLEVAVRRLLFQPKSPH